MNAITQLIATYNSTYTFHKKKLSLLLLLLLLQYEKQQLGCFVLHKRKSHMILEQHNSDTT